MGLIIMFWQIVFLLFICAICYVCAVTNQRMQNEIDKESQYD